MLVVKWAILLVAMLLSGCAVTSDGGGPLLGAPETPLRWADADEALVAPGLQGTVYGDGFGVSYTFGFLLATPDNATMYAATVAHALHLGEGNDIPLGAEAMVGDTVVGTFVYDGWAQQSDDFGSDFALIELNDAGRRLAHPAVRGWGGPTGIADADAQVPLYRLLTFGATTGGPNTGRVVDEDDGFALARFDNAVQPGDSGSPVLSWDGRALGHIVGHLALQGVGLAGEPEKVTVFSSLDANLERAAAEGFDLVVATAGFEAPLLPLAAA